MTLRLFVLTLAIAVTTLSVAAWQSWATRDAVFLTPEATGVRVVVPKPGVRQITYQAAEGWRTVVLRQMDQGGWYMSAPVTPTPQYSYYRVTFLWLGYLTETAVLRGGEEQAEIMVQWGFVWRSWGVAGVCETPLRVVSSAPVCLYG